MAVKIGSARIDENGHAHGGKAGDQTGREVSTQNWYKHSKGWRVFRAKDPEARERIALCMERACKNSHIGYDQYQRLTLYDAAKPYDFDVAKVTKDCETDCSALVRVCCAYAGIMLSNFRTVNQPSVMLKSGAFTEMKGVKYTDHSTYLRRGDVLVTPVSGHTVVVLTDGAKADEDAAAADVKTAVRITGGSVYVRKGPGVQYVAIGIAHRGDLLAYGGETSGGWFLVDFHNQNGWVSGKYAEVV